MLFSQPSPRPFFAAPCRDMSIDALQLLTAQIAAQVQMLVRPQSLEGKHSDLLQSTYTAFEQGLAIVGGLLNAAAPINRIPSELLADIFALSPNTRLGPGYWPFEEPCVDDLHKLTKVCRYWRELSLVTPTLWNTIVTIRPSQRDLGDEYYFRRSIYLPDDLSIGSTVHLETRTTPSPRSVGRMTKFMLRNASRIRELHVWGSSSIEDLPSFLRSFDATALEHCTISQRGGDRRSYRLVDLTRWSVKSEPEHLLFFSNGGARLRSLYLDDIRVLPENEFPALTFLKIGFFKRPNADLALSEVHDAIKFLAGSPNLEEVYIHINSVPPSRHDSSSNHPVSPTAISLPRLRHLALIYYLDTYGRYGDGDVALPIDLFLERVSIPPTCHMYFAAPNRTTDILASVCRHVSEKDVISHMFLRLSFLTVSSPIHLVFRQGSLRLLPSYTAGNSFPYLDLFCAFPHLFATTKELRIHYTNDPMITELDPSFITAAFPNISALSVLRDVQSSDGQFLGPVGGAAVRDPTLRAGLAHLVPYLSTPTSNSPSAGVESESEEREHWRYPTLDTLWVSLKSSDEIAELETMLAARAALGLPIRRLVVTLFYYPSVHSLYSDGDSDSESEDPVILRSLSVLDWESGPDDLARLRALGAEEVVVMEEAASCEEVEEVDWLVKWPERYNLPASIHRDWPTVWCPRK